MTPRSSAPESLLLPAATRLVHIGPHKTGTTALQGAFHTSRARLREHGVAYGGHESQPIRAVLAMTGQRQMLGEAVPKQHHWSKLVANVKSAGDKRVLISSEFFCEAGEDAARKMIEGLGGPQAHVVITLRSLAKIVPSQWQQWVQNGLREPYETWLDTLLNEPDEKRLKRKFWHRHEHGRLVERWTNVVGKDNLTVVVVDEGNQGMLLRTFEQMLGLPDEFLVVQKSRANRSLTLAETEILRQFNQEFKRQPLPDWLYAKYLRRGAVMHMKAARQPASDEPRIVTPPWALKRAAEIGAESASRIEALGVRVVGDISTLGAVAEDSAEAAAEPSLDVTAEAAAGAVLGAVLASGDADPDSQVLEDRRVRTLSSRVLLGLVLRRVGNRFGHRVPRKLRGFLRRTLRKLTKV